MFAKVSLFCRRLFRTSVTRAIGAEPPYNTDITVRIHCKAGVTGAAFRSSLGSVSLLQTGPHPFGGGIVSPTTSSSPLQIPINHCQSTIQGEILCCCLPMPSSTRRIHLVSVPIQVLNIKFARRDKFFFYSNGVLQQFLGRCNYAKHRSRS